MKLLSQIWFSFVLVFFSLTANAASVDCAKTALPPQYASRGLDHAEYDSGDYLAGNISDQVVELSQNESSLDSSQEEEASFDVEVPPSWFQLRSLDINRDGLCDWLVIASTALTNGGDSDVLNTFYLANTTGWVRHGAAMQSSDSLDHVGRAFGRTVDFELFSDVIVVPDTDWLIGYFSPRDTRLLRHPGYRIFRWNNVTGNLQVFDKWQDGSPASVIYQAFRKGELKGFDSEIENYELMTACTARTGEAILSQSLKSVCEAEVLSRG